MACHGPGGNSVTAGIPSIAGPAEAFPREPARADSRGAAPLAADAADREGHEGRGDRAGSPQHFSQAARRSRRQPAKPDPEARAAGHGAGQGAALRRVPSCGFHAARTRCRAWPRSARTICSPRCGPTATTSARAATRSWPRRSTACPTRTSRRSRTSFRGCRDSALARGSQKSLPFRSNHELRGHDATEPPSR